MKHTLHNSMGTGEYLFGMGYLIAQQFAIPHLLVRIPAYLGIFVSDVMLNFAFFVLNFLVIIVAFGRYFSKNIRHLGKNFFHVLCVCLAGFVVYWAASFLVNLAVALYLPDHINANDAHIQSMASQQYLLMFIGSVLLVPLVEETLFRGVVFGFLDRYNRPLAYVLSSLLFAAIHVAGYVGAVAPVYLLVSFLQYLPAGLCLSWAYAQTDTIFAPVLIHTAVNLMGMLAMR